MNLPTVVVKATVTSCDWHHNTPTGNSIWTLTTDLGTFKTAANAAMSAGLPGLLPLNVPLALHLNGNGRVSDFNGWGVTW